MLYITRMMSCYRTSRTEPALRTEEICRDLAPIRAVESRGTEMAVCLGRSTASAQEGTCETELIWLNTDEKCILLKFRLHFKVSYFGKAN